MAADLGGAVVFFKLHGDILDVLLHFRDHDIFQRVDAAAGLLNFGGEQLRLLFGLRQFQHILKHGGQRTQCVVQFARRLCEAVGIDGSGVLAFGVERVDRDGDGHDVLERHVQCCRLLGVQKRLLEHFGGHHA